MDDGVAWGDLAVVVRRQGAHVGGLLRALDDTRVPRTAPETGVSLAQEPATRPFVLALRFLAAKEDERNGLIESVLTSDLVRLSPAAARGLLRVAHARTGSVGRALEFTDGLTAQEAAQVEEVRGVLDRAAKAADRSVLDTFAILWRELPCSRRLVDEGDASVESRRELDSVVAFSSAVAEAGSAADPSVEAFLASVDAGERGPGFSAWERREADAVQVLTAHGAAGREFHTVIVVGTVEGNFPSLSRPEPMFDLDALDRLVSQSDRNRARLEDERRLFRMVLGRAKERVVLMASRAHADEASTGLAVRRGARAQVVVRYRTRGSPSPSRSARPRPCGAGPSRTRRCPAAERLAALDGLVTLGVDPRRWWFQRDWTDTGRPLHEHLRASYSKLDVLDNCELQFVLGSELGLGRPVGYQAWVGSLVHRIIEDCEKGEVARTLEALTAEVDRRWRPQEFPAKAVSEAWRALAKGTDAPQLVRALRRAPGLGHRARIRVRLRRRDDRRIHRPHRPGPGGIPREPHHGLQDGQRRSRPEGEREPPARHLLPGRPRIRGAGGVPAGLRRRALLSQGPLAHRRARDAGVDGRHDRSRRGLPERDAREALRPRRRAADASTRRAPTAPTTRRTASSASSSRSARSSPRAGRCSMSATLRSPWRAAT